MKRVRPIIHAVQAERFFLGEGRIQAGGTAWLGTVLTGLGTAGGGGAGGAPAGAGCAGAGCAGAGCAGAFGPGYRRVTLSPITFRAILEPSAGLAIGKPNVPVIEHVKALPVA